MRRIADSQRCDVRLFASQRTCGACGGHRDAAGTCMPCFVAGMTSSAVGWVPRLSRGPRVLASEPPNDGFGSGREDVPCDDCTLWSSRKVSLVVAAG